MSNKERTIDIDPIRVFIIDDHSLTRKGLNVVFNRETDIQVVGESDALVQELVIPQILESKPDIILLDIRLGEKTSFNLADQIKEHMPDTRIIMLTGYDDPLFAIEALSHCTDGFLTKDCSSELLCSALRIVYKGGTFWQGSFLQEATRSLLASSPISMLREIADHTSPQHNPRKLLSLRELQILTALGKGMSNKDISQQMSLSEFIVKKSIHEIFLKLGFTHRSQAAVYANKTGLY